MVGVPKAWRAFATRGYASRLDQLRDELEFAISWGGPRTVVLVLGEAPATEAVCREREFAGNAIYCPGHQSLTRAKRRPYVRLRSVPGGREAG
jgi:hypothetical protein